MKIEVGKFYMTRSGKKAFVHHKTRQKEYCFVLVGRRTGFSCTQFGEYLTCGKHGLDLISTWEDSLST